MTLTLLSRALPFLIHLLPYIVPFSWGTVHANSHSLQSASKTVFLAVSTVSFLLYARSTAVALFYNIPDRNYHRYDLLHPFQESRRSPLDRGSTAVGNLFGALAEHPAVGAVGWDVLLTALSLGTWAATRGLDAGKMLESSILFVRRQASPEEIARELNPTNWTLAGKSLASSDAQETPRRRATRSNKSSLSLTNHVLDTDAYEPTPADQKSSSSSLTPEGDEDALGEEWELAALTWGLMSLAGLGVGASAVFGAEMRAR